MHQSPQQVAGIGGLDALDHFTGFYTGDGMADRADTANPRRDHRHFGIHPAFTEFFKSPEFIHMK